jgi:ferrous iron transport protein A
MISAGDNAVIKRIGGQEETRRFLENLGFTVGEQIKVVSANSGNIIVQVKESRVAVSKGIANKIMV